MSDALLNADGQASKPAVVLRLALKASPQFVFPAHKHLEMNLRSTRSLPYVVSLANNPKACSYNQHPNRFDRISRNEGLARAPQFS
jgi:hypothetical protein